MERRGIYGSSAQNSHGKGEKARTEENRGVADNDRSRSISVMGPHPQRVKEIDLSIIGEPPKRVRLHVRLMFFLGLGDQRIAGPRCQTANAMLDSPSFVGADQLVVVPARAQPGRAVLRRVTHQQPVTPAER